VYDFVGNRLVGVWVGDFTGETEAVAPAAPRLTFTLMPGVLPDSLLIGVPWALAHP
jgi:hypothetical protein